MQASQWESARTSEEASGVGVLVEGITSLVDKVNSIDARFLEVRRILMKTPFDPDDDFGEHYKKYINLIWKSRRIAGGAGVASDDFCGDLLDLLLSNGSVSKEEKIQEFETVLAGWRNDGERDSQLSQDFEELSNALKGFDTALAERIARATDAETRSQSEIDQLDAVLARMPSGPEVMLRRFLLVISGACQQARQSFQRVGIIRTWLIVFGMLGSQVFTVFCKSFETAYAALESCLRGSISDALHATFVAIHEAVDKFQHFLCFLVTSKEDHRSQMSILRENLRDIQLATERRAIILAGVNAITADVNSLSIEVTSLNDIFNLLTAESVQILASLRSDSQVVDLPAKTATLKRELAPVGRALAAYSRAQRI